MGTLAFLLLHAFKQLSSPYDSYVFCFLLALDTSSAVRIWLWRQSGR